MVRDYAKQIIEWQIYHLFIWILIS